MSKKPDWNPSEDGPKVTIEYILPHHADDLKCSMQATDMRYILIDLLDNLRSCQKYDSGFDGFVMLKTVDGKYPEERDKRELDPGKGEAIEKIREWLLEALADRKIDLGS